jgi:hypothetical protein
MTQEQVTRFAQISAMLRDLGKERDRLRDEAVKMLENGSECPSDGPFVLELSYQDRSPQWKEIYLSLLGILSDRTRSKVEKYVALRLADKTEVPQVNVKVNANYRQEKAA